MVLTLLLACSPVSAPLPATEATHRPRIRTGFVVPDLATRTAAIGPVSQQVRTLFDPAAFPPLPAPQPGDWLAEHEEPGETFAQYLADPGRTPTADQRTLYIQPVGTPDVDLDLVSRFAGAWFGLPVTVLPQTSLEATGATTRKRAGRSAPQVLTTDLMTWLQGRMPDDAFAIVAITSSDLYPDPEWNYVFGQATYTLGVGVWSTARYDPAFFGEDRPSDWQRTRLARTLKVMVHELGHMHGVRHCVHFACVMNGSNSLEETDAQPHHLGPVCLRKLLWATGTAPTGRYRALEALYLEAGMTDQASWVGGRAERLGSRHP